MRAHQILCCLLFALLAGQLTASGLTLYSYQDELGQIIVVDSLERIPEKYRDGAKRGFIPAFRSSPAAEKPSAVIEAVPDRAEIRPSAPDRFKVSPPPEEVEGEIGIASATSCMAQLRLLHLNNERIYLAARDNGLQFPSISHLHLGNGQLIVGFAFPDEMSTAEGKAWLKEAQNLYGQLRSVHINITGWLSTNSQELFVAMPILLTRVRGMLGELEAAFAAIPAGK